MKQLKLFEGLSRTEKRIISSTFFLILFLFIVVNSYDFSSFGKSQNQIGQIQELTNNTRVKSNERVLWQSARERQSIHVGDKVFTGKKSTATIKLGRQGSFSLGENSLVEFQTVNRQKVANFKNGTYRLFSNGNVKIAINGKMAEINAKNSEFEIVVNGTNNIQIKTIQGDGQIKIDNAVTVLNSDVVAKPNAIERTVAKAAVPKVDIPPFVDTYSPTLYDEYVREQNVLKKRSGSIRVVRKTIRVPVPTDSPSQQITIQHSATNTFASNYEHKTYGFDKKIQKVFLGENFWRFKTEDESWSDTFSFTIQRQYPPHSKPELHLKSPQLFLIGSVVQGGFSVSTPYAAIGYVIETSASGNFENDSKISWQKSKTVNVNIIKTGSLYFRARSVDKDFRLSEWSDTHSFNVTTPPELQPIVLKVSQPSIRVGESVFARWEPQASIKKYRFCVKKGSKNILTVPLHANSSDWFPKVPGSYQLSVTATDEFGRSLESNIEDVKVDVPFVLTKAPIIERMPSTEEQIPIDTVESAPVDVTTTVEVSPRTRNRYYTHSFLTLSTSHFSLQSKPLADSSGETFAQSAGLSADYLYWINNHGLQAILQKSLISLSSGIGESDIFTGEARYRYRFTPSTVAQFTRVFQFAGFLGYEVYKNSKDTFFLSSYNFLKAGVALDFPVFDRFVISGLGAYGVQSSAMKYELGWDLTYFMRNRIGIGLGYKLNFVEFDLTNEFPGYAPYREAYAQGTLSFKYFF